MPTRSRRALLALDAWPAVLAVVLVLPLLTGSGYPLARDLVFVPRQPFTDASFGLGDAAPRAVPLDALVALLTTVVDGGVLARVLLPLVLAVAGWGAHRMVAHLGTPARLVAGGLAVWNPYVVERMALGQWALLAGYAALPWIGLAATRYRASGSWRDLAAVVAWLGLAAITPTGGVLGLATALALGAGRQGAVRLVAAGAVLQLPWLLPALVGGAGLTSDPDAVAAFAARAEGAGGVLVAVLGLGGTWDAGTVPGSRETWWVAVVAAVFVAATALAWRPLRRAWGPGTSTRWSALALVSLLAALAAATGPGADLLRWAVTTVPGAGLLRDGQKLLAPAVVLVVASVATVADAGLARVRRLGTEVTGAVAALAVALPVLLLPDATAVVWPSVEPVELPVAVTDLPDVVAPGEDDARVALLPWRSYRRFEWGTGLISSDPGLRLLDADVQADDRLAVGVGGATRTVQGESPLARDLGERLETMPVAGALAPDGIGWVVVWRDDPAAEELDLAGLEPVAESPEVAVYRNPLAFPEVAATPAWAAVTVRAVDAAVLLLVLVAWAVAAGAARRRTRW